MVRRLVSRAGRALARRRTVRGDCSGAPAPVLARRHGDQRFRALFEHAPLGVALCTLDGQFVDVNQAVRDLLVDTGVHPDTGGLPDLTRVRGGVEWLREVDAVRRGDLPVARADLPFTTAAGRRWLSLTVVRIGLGEDPYMLVHLDDVTARRAEEERLTDLALRDPLTGLANRTLVRTSLDAALARAATTGLCAAVLYLDLDRFKRVNDTLGHDVGDALLIAVADRLSRTLRFGDVAGRLGGDEFLVVAENVPSEQALAELVRRVAEAMEPPVAVRGQEVGVEVSVGAVLSRPNETGSQLIRRADAAMFADKRTRRRGLGHNSGRPTEPETVQLSILREQALVADRRI